MEEQIINELPEKYEVVDIQFRPGQKVYFFDPAGHTLQMGDHVIIDTARGPEYGICAAGNHQIPMKDVVGLLHRWQPHRVPQGHRGPPASRAAEGHPAG